MVLKKLVDLSRLKAEALCKKLETARNEMNDSSFWCDMTQQHIKLDKHLETLWRVDHGGALLLVDMAHRLSWAVILAVCAIGSQRQDVIVFFVATASASVSFMLMHLYPMAQVTSLCQSRNANKRSVIRLAVTFVNHK